VLENVRNNYTELKETRKDLAALAAEFRTETGKFYTKLSAIELELATFKTEMKLKSGIWGFVAGAIPVALAILYKLIEK